MSIKNSISKTLKVFEKITLLISGLSIMILMLLITLDVFLRNVFSFTFVTSYELSESYLMPLAIFPILHYIYSSNSLPKIEFLLEKVSFRLRKIINIIVPLIEIFAFALLTSFGWQKAVSGTKELLAFPAGGIMYPVYPVLYLVPLGFGMLTLIIIIKVIKEINEFKENL